VLGDLIADSAASLVEHDVSVERAADAHLAASELDRLILRPGVLVDDPGGLVNAGDSSRSGGSGRSGS
jgi:hypothetical protein